MKTYGLMGTNYKAVVNMDADGNETLISYGTPIITMHPDGTLTKLWDGWTATTGKHIKAFCGLNKAQYMSLQSKGEMM